MTIEAKWVWVLFGVAACEAQYVTPMAADEVEARLGNWADQDTHEVGTHRVIVDALNVRDASQQVIDVAQRDQLMVTTGTTRTWDGLAFVEASFRGGALDGWVGFVAAQHLAFSELQVCGGGPVAVRDPHDLGRVIGEAEAGDNAYVVSGTVRNTGAHRYFLLSTGGQHGYVATDSLCAPGTMASTPAGSAAVADSLLVTHDLGRTVFWDQTFGRADGASPLDNLSDTAAGRPAKTSCYGTAPCDTVPLRNDLLDGLYALQHTHGFDYFVTSIAGASHSAGSLHYDGRAVDVDEVDGVRILGDSPQARSFMNACWALGAIEVFGPSNDPYGHRDHIHCAW